MFEISEGEIQPEAHLIYFGACLIAGIRLATHRQGNRAISTTVNESISTAHQIFQGVFQTRVEREVRQNHFMPATTTKAKQPLNATPKEERTEKILYSRKEAAGSLSISVRQLDNLITLGLLKPTRIGKTVNIHIKQIEKFAAGDHPKLTERT